MSGSRDKTIKLWNTLGECKYTIGEPDGHTEWVSCVRFSPVVNNPLIVSAGWDRQVKVGSCIEKFIYRASGSYQALQSRSVTLRDLDGESGCRSFC